MLLMLVLNVELSQHYLSLTISIEIISVIVLVTANFYINDIIFDLFFTLNNWIDTAKQQQRKTLCVISLGTSVQYRTICFVKTQYMGK